MCDVWRRAVRILQAPSSRVRDFVRGALPHESFFQSNMSSASSHVGFRFSTIHDGLCARHWGRDQGGGGEPGDRIGIARMDPLASVSTTPEAVLSHPSFAMKWRERFRVRHYELHDMVGDLDYAALPVACNKRYQALEDHNTRLTRTYNITSVPTMLIVSPSGHVTWRGTSGWMEHDEASDDKFKVKPVRAGLAQEPEGELPPPDKRGPQDQASGTLAEFPRVAEKAFKRFVASKIRQAQPKAEHGEGHQELVAPTAEERAAQVAARLQRQRPRQHPAGSAVVLECAVAKEAATKWPWDEQDEQDLAAMVRTDEIMLARQRRGGKRLAEAEKEDKVIMSGGYEGWRPSTIAATLPAADRTALLMSLKRWRSYTKTTKGQGAAGVGGVVPGSTPTCA